MAWPKGVPKKGYVKGSMKRVRDLPPALLAIPEAPEPKAGPLLYERVLAEIFDLKKRVASLKDAPASTRTESTIERLRRVVDEIDTWGAVAHYASSRSEDREVRAFCKERAASLRRQAVELVRCHMQRVEEFRKRNPLAYEAGKEK